MCHVVFSGLKSARCSWKRSTISSRNFTPASRHSSCTAEVSLLCSCYNMFRFNGTCLLSCIRFSFFVANVSRWLRLMSLKLPAFLTRDIAASSACFPHSIAIAVLYCLSVVLKFHCYKEQEAQLSLRSRANMLSVEIW